jgi:hypothetical protein
VLVHEHQRRLRLVDADELVGALEDIFGFGGLRRRLHLIVSRILMLAGQEEGRLPSWQRLLPKQTCSFELVLS